MDELKRHFRPEFLNRIDEVIVFHQLSREQVKSIVDLMMRRVVEQLKSKDIAMELTDQARELLAERGYDPALGARPLRRTIQRLVEDPLSEKLLWKEFTAGQLVVVDAEDGAIAFRSLDQPTETDIDVPPAELAGKE
jgi:ATP-dependent Clp protease ATP-binding subunit ClpC